MKKYNLLAVALFLTAFVAGSFVMGAGVSAQTTTTPPALACVFTMPSVAAGTSATLSASGGTGSYTWSSPGLVITNPTGTNFTVTFNAAGTYPVTVTSGSQTSTCYVHVTAVENVPTGGTVTGTTTPGLPNTGEKFGG